MPLVPEGFVWIISYVIGYLVVGNIQNLFLITEKKGAKFRWNLSPFKPYLKKEKAIVLAILQFLIPFVLAIFISDFIFGILEKTDFFIIPISVIVLTIAYTHIRSTLPYKITGREKIIHAAILSVSVLIFLVMLFDFTDQIIEKFRWIGVK